MKKKLQAIFAKLSEAFKGLSDEDKKKLAESHKAALALVEAEGESEDEAMDAMLSKREGESDEDHMARLHKMAKGIAAHIGKAAAGEAGNPDAEPAPKADDADAAESKRDALAGLIKESGLPKDFYDKSELTRLGKMPYTEAKREVQKDAKLAKSIGESTAGSVASFHRGAVQTEGNLTRAFCESARKED